MGTLYTHTYIYANGYLDLFRQYFNNDYLTWQGLTAILKTFYKRKKWQLETDRNGNLWWRKSMLNDILNQPGFYKPQFKKMFDEWDAKRIKKEWEREPSDITMDGADMEKVSNGLVSQDNYDYGEVVEGLLNEMVEAQQNPDYDEEKTIDVSDVNQVNAYAKKVFGTTDYFRHAGYLLTDGTMLDFCGTHDPRDVRGTDHRGIDINGVGMNEFIALGNIRLIPETPGFDFCRVPTAAQIKVIERFIRELGYRAGYMIVERCDENGRSVWSKEYEKTEFRNIIRDIQQTNSNNQSELSQFLQEKTMKKIRITESQFKRILDEEMAKIKFIVEPEKVMIVKKYADDNFMKAGMPMLGDDGFPTTLPIVVLKGTDGQPAKKMTDKQLFYYLQSKFDKIYSNKHQRNRFIQQFIKDWYYDKITKDGLLSVNFF